MLKFTNKTSALTLAWMHITIYGVLGNLPSDMEITTT